MRTASRAAWSGQPWGRLADLPILDPSSQQMERDADATMTADERHDYVGYQGNMSSESIVRATVGRDIDEGLLPQ